MYLLNLFLLNLNLTYQFNKSYAIAVQESSTRPTELLLPNARSSDLLATPVAENAKSLKTAASMPSLT